MKKNKRPAEDQNDFILLMEYGLGGEIDGDHLDFRKGYDHNSGLVNPDYTYRTDHVELAKQLGLCNGFRHWNWNAPENLEHSMAGGFTGALVDIWSARWAQWAARRGKRTREYVDEMMDVCRGLVRKYGDRVWVNTYPEYDNAQWDEWAARHGPLKDRAEAFRRLRELYESDNDLNMLPPPDDPAEPRPVGGQRPGDYLDAPAAYQRRVRERGLKYLSAYNYLKQRKMTPADINLVNLCCQTFTPHLIYAMGARAAWPEGNVGNNHQVTIAFVRGAARQYRRVWCYDTAPFDCHCKGLPMAYDRRRRRISGFTESYILRAWLVSYLSGAKTFLFQASDMGFFIRDRNDKLELTPIGEIGRDFADFCLRRHPQRGRARAPVALLLAQDHGYTPPYHNCPRLFGGALPDDRPNRSIEGFFRLAFPGFQDTHSTSCIDNSAWAPALAQDSAFVPQRGTAADQTEDRPGSWARQYPWLKPGMGGGLPDCMREVTEYVRAYRETIRDEKIDFRPYEKPMLTVTTWGDSFDVLVDNAPAEVLKDYPALILLGSIKLDADLRRRLTAYVKAGGRVLLNAAQVTKADADLLGLDLTGNTERQPGHTYSRLTGRVFSEGRFRYAQVVPHKGVDTLVEAGFLGAQGHPVVTRRKLGKGEVWFVAVPDCLPIPEKLDLSWLEACKEAVDEFIRPHLGLEIQGPALEWLINDTPDGAQWVTLINNSPETWAGRAILRDDIGQVTARDIWNEKAVRFEYDAQGRVVLKIEIAPWAFKVLEIKAVEQAGKLR